MREKWENNIEYFIIRNMLTKREEGTKVLISDYGGDIFLRNSTLLKHLAKYKINLNETKLEEAAKRLE